MGLSAELISQFAKITNDNSNDNKNIGTTVYGTIVKNGDTMYVKLDGSDVVTPISTTTEIKSGERVMVTIKNHVAIVSGNISSPSASTNTVNDIKNKIIEFEAQSARIDNLESENVTIKGLLIASEAEISDLLSDNITINNKLTASNAEIEILKVGKLDVERANAIFASIERLDATDANVYNLTATYGEFKVLEADYGDFKELTVNQIAVINGYIQDLDIDKLSAISAEIENLVALYGAFTILEADYGDFKVLTTDQLSAIGGHIQDLDTNKLSVVEADMRFANIDFSNIGEAAIEKLFAGSGLIRDLVVGDGTITGELIGVTIRGDLIIGNTIVADKLVVKGEDGLYYKLNTDGMTVDAEQTEYNSLNGSVITANSITATKISVDDLVAFDATIGGFEITETSIYSGVKSSVDNTTRGIYFDNTGQIAFGDSNNFLKYYKDADGTFKLAISAGSIILNNSNMNVETMIAELQDEIAEKAGAADMDTLADIVSDINAELEYRAQRSELEAMRAAFDSRLEQEIRDKDQLVADLATMAGRMSFVETIAGSSKITTEFIDTVITQSNEGIFIGANNMSTGILVGEDRVSFINNNVEVAYISNQTMKISHGIFVESATISDFKFEKIPGTKILTITWVGD